MTKAPPAKAQSAQLQSSILNFVLLDAQAEVEQDVRVAVIAVEAFDFEQAHGACTPPR